MTSLAPTEVEVSGNGTGFEVPNPITFSAQFNDTAGHEAVECQIQVNTDSGFSGRMMWDSDWVPINNVPDGDRSEEIQYNGYEMTPYEIYYVRMRFTDTNSDITNWSAVT